jgi:hypothetical protein
MNENRLEDTDNQGRFVFRNLIDGEYGLSVSATNYVFQTLRGIRPTSQPVEVVLESGVTLRGTIRDSEGHSIEKFFLSLTDPHYGGQDRSWRVIDSSLLILCQQICVRLVLARDDQQNRGSHARVERLGIILTARVLKGQPSGTFIRIRAWS